MVSGLMNVAPELAEAVAKGLGMPDLPEAMPKAARKAVKPEVTKSAALSLFARPGDGSIRARRVAIGVADGVNGKELVALAARLTAEGAIPRFLASRLGRVTAADGETLEVDTSFEATPSVLYDGFVLPDGTAAAKALASDGRVLEFLKDQYRHCKPILVLGASSALLDKAGIPKTLPSGGADPGLLVVKSGAGDKAGDAFKTALAAHRHFARETDPPRV
jgi:catalase